MSIKSLFVPEILKTYHSDFNGEIKLIRFAEDLRLDVGGLTQSGGVMVWIWSQAIHHLLPRDFQPESILFLGLGGGSVIKWLARRYPQTKLTAVEIDPVMIEIAREHFGIGKVKNLTLINDDAVNFVKQTKEKFSLTLNDCYQGFKTPKGFEEIAVLKKMKAISDHILINRLYWDDFKIKTDDFVAKISPHFQIKSVYTASNLIISLDPLQGRTLK